MLTVNIKKQPDIRFQDGGLPHAMGVHSFQILRANRAHPEEADGFGWTYNHAPMIAWYCGRYYVEYLSNPVSEHETPGQTLMCSSEDGVNWSFPRVVFPIIEMPLDCYKGPRGGNMPEKIKTVPHQRMGFYCSSNGCMLLLSFYGIVHDRRISAPCDGWGVGRAVRRIHPDGSLGGICFLIYNEEAGYTRQTATAYPYFEDSGDEEMIAACRQLLGDRAALNQMYEEQRNDKVLFPVPLKQAPSFYTVRGGEMVTVFKRGLSMRSEDGGETWGGIVPNPTLKTATGKVWGQKTDDGRFALLYNPTPDGQHRWPIAIVSGDDGYAFGDMRAVTGSMSPQRYGGLDKNLGPQYMRGICERNPQAPDGKIHLVYSNNKEDIWISHIPPQAGLEAEAEISERFEGPDFPAAWNVYSPKWAPVRMTGSSVRLSDREPCDRALIERCLAASERGELEMELRVGTVAAPGEVCVELYDEAGGVAAQLLITPTAEVRVRSGGRDEKWLEQPADGRILLKMAFDCRATSFALECESRRAGFSMSTACDRVCRVSIATKSPRRVPYNDIFSNGKYGSPADDLPGTDEKTAETWLELVSFKFTGN